MQDLKLLYEVIANSIINIDADEFYEATEHIEALLAKMLVCKILNDDQKYEECIDEVELHYPGNTAVVLEIFKSLMDAVQYCKNKDKSIFKELAYNLKKQYCIAEVELSAQHLSSNSAFIYFTKDF